MKNATKKAPKKETGYFSRLWFDKSSPYEIYEKNSPLPFSIFFKKMPAPFLNDVLFLLNDLGHERLFIQH
jgi:hypothetical protein